MAKTIGHLAAIISANVTAFNAGLDQAGAKARSFALQTNATLNSGGGAAGFSADISAAVRKSAEDLDFVNQQVAHVAKGVEYNGNSIGANFGKMSTASKAAARQVSGSASTIGGAFSSVRASVGRATATIAIAVTVAETLRRAFRDAASDAHEFVGSLDFSNAIGSTKAIDDRIKEIQTRLGASRDSFVGLITNAVIGNSQSQLEAELEVLEGQRDVLARRMDRDRADAENAAAWEEYDEDMKRYREHLKNKEALHRQIVDQIDAASVAAEQDEFKRLALEKDIAIGQLQREWSNKGLDKQLDQLVGLIMKRYENDRDELLKSMSSDISDMMEEDVEEAVKKTEPARNVAAAGRPGNNELLRATGANILQSVSSSLVTSLEKRAAQQLQESKRQTALLGAIAGNTTDDDPFNG